MPRDGAGHIIVLPAIVDALRMVSEALDQTTVTAHLTGAARSQVSREWTDDRGHELRGAEIPPRDTGDHRRGVQHLVRRVAGSRGEGADASIPLPPWDQGARRSVCQPGIWPPAGDRA